MEVAGGQAGELPLRGVGLAGLVPSPADGGPAGAEGAGVGAAGRYGGELPLWGVGLAGLVPSPADGGPAGV